jgi:hypothetical protein
MRTSDLFASCHNLERWHVNAILTATRVNIGTFTGLQKAWPILQFLVRYLLYGLVSDVDKAYKSSAR